MDPTSTDPSDWKGTSLEPLTAIDSLLRCQVCKEYLQNAVITSCAHTFCSLCIRRCLTADGKCPACRTTEQETRLRRNVIVQEICERFIESRPKLLEAAREDSARQLKASESSQNTHETQTLGKRKRNDKDSEHGPNDSQAGPRRSLRTRNNVQNSDKRDESTSPQNLTDSPTLESPEEEQNTPESHTVISERVQHSDRNENDGLVACPMCSRRMKEEQVYFHLDTCGSEPTGQEQTKQANRSSDNKSQSRELSSPPTRLPSLPYGVLKDRQLQSKMASLGIPSAGSRDLLIRRHKEWLNLWNANCDSAHPKRKQELLRELALWEKTLGSRAHSGTGFKTAADSTSQLMNKDFDGQAWSMNNRDNFKDLIAKARASGSAKMVTQNGSNTTETIVQKQGVESMSNARENNANSPQVGDARSYGSETDSSPNAQTVARSSEAALPSTTSRKGTGTPPQNSQVYVGPLFDNANHFLYRSSPLVGSTPADQGTPSTHQESPYNATQEFEPGPVQMFRRSSLTIAKGVKDGDMPRKVPMFEVPNQPVVDADFGGHDTTQ